MKGRPRDPATPTQPAFPAWKAFVVQFAQGAAEPDALKGRVEHMSSGRRAYFETSDELVSNLKRLLRELSKEGLS